LNPNHQKIIEKSPEKNHQKITRKKSPWKSPEKNLVNLRNLRFTPRFIPSFLAKLAISSIQLVEPEPGSKAMTWVAESNR